MTDADGNPLPATIETVDADGNEILTDSDGNPVEEADPTGTAAPTPGDGTPAPTPTAESTTGGTAPSPAVEDPTVPASATTEPATSSEPSDAPAAATGPAGTPSSEQTDAPVANEQEQLIAGATPAAPANPAVLLPSDGSYSDSREIAAAEAAGVATPAGQPLSAAAIATIRDLELALGSIEQWVGWMRKRISGLPKP